MTQKFRTLPAGRWILPLTCMVVWILWASTLPAASEDRGQCLNGSGDNAAAACARVLKGQPDDLKILLAYGDRLQEAGKISEAVAVFRRASALAPENNAVKRKLSIANSMAEEASWLEKRKKQTASKAPPAKESTRVKLDRIRCTSLRGEKGLAACNDALAAMPEDAALHAARGDHLLQLGRIEEAKAAFAAALRNDPDSEDYATKLAALGGTAPPAGTAGSGSVAAQKAGEKIPAPTEPSHAKLVEQLSLLKSLRDQDLITEDEFNRRKKELLDSTLQPASGAAAGRPSGPDTAASLDLGDYHALVIGIQNYEHLPRLESSRRDAVAVAELLENRYRFQVRTLFDVTRREILIALNEYRRSLGKKDNLLIYYAGHGWLDEEADAGYWMPVNAATDSDVDWLSLNTITASIRAISAKHVMIVADSCYSGKLTRGIHVRRKTNDYYTAMAGKRARVVLTSGGLEPVLDSGGKGGHSVFAAAFLQALRQNDKIMDGTTLFTQIRRPVMLNASQSPEYADIRQAGHEGGDFLFVPR